MKKIVTLLFSLLLIENVFAADIEYTINAGDDTPYTMYFNILTDEDENPTNNVEVTYEGDSGTTGGSYSVSEVEIPGSIEYQGDTYTVTAIGEYAFYNCSSLTSVFIPASVTEIGFMAFAQDVNLSSVTFEDDSQLRTIGKTAFFSCSFTEITIPAFVESFGTSAFNGCTSLITVTCLAETPPTLSSYDFLDCNNLQYLYVPYCSLDLYKADDGTYGWATSFSEENINTYEEIYEGNSFDEDGITYEVTSQCDGYTVKISGYTQDLPAELTIPATVNYSDIDFTVTEIGESAFYDCTSLTSVTFAENSQLTTIGESTFYLCNSLLSFTIPASVTELGTGVFEECNSIEKITFEEGSQITSIPTNTFYNCTFLKDLTIPSTVSEIGDKAFSGCALTSLTINGTTMTELSPEDFAISTDGCILYVDEELRTNYHENGWAEYFTIYGYNAVGDIFVVDGIKYEIIEENQAEIIDLTQNNVEFVDVVEYNLGSFQVVSINLDNFEFSETIEAKVNFIDPQTISFVESNNEIVGILSVPDGTVEIYENSDWATYFQINGNNTFTPEGSLISYTFKYRTLKASSSTIVLEVTSVDESVTNITIPKSVDLNGNSYEVSSIDSEALTECKNLTQIILEADIPVEDATALTKIPDDCLVVVPDGKEEQYAQMFTEAGLTSVVVKSQSEYDNDNNTTAYKKINRDILEIERFNLLGQKISEPQKGINIVKYSDGTIKKILVK